MKRSAISRAIEALEARQLLSTSLYTANFEGSAPANLDNFTFSPTTSNLWHVSNLSYQSGTASLYYGQETTQNYDTGAANSGSALSPAISLTGKTAASLRFRYYLYTDAMVDTASVSITADGGTTWTELGSNASGTLTDSPTWQLFTADLTPYVGKSVQLKFTFDTGDEIGNDYTGWFVDDIVVADPGGNPAPEVTSSPNWGDTITTSSTSIAVTFSEAVSGVTTSNLVLGGYAGSGATVTGVSMSTDKTVATFTVNNLRPGVLVSTLANTNTIVDSASQPVLPVVAKQIILLPDAYEAGNGNNTSDTATDLGRIGGSSAPVPLSNLTLDTSTDVDWYKFVPDATGDATVTLKGNILVADLALSAYSSSDLVNPIATSDAATDNQTITIPGAVGGQTYYIKVNSNYSDTTYNYGLQINTAFAAPKVTAVYVRGTTWTTSFVSSLSSQALGDGTFGYQIPTGSTAQLKALPWTNINQVSVRFSEGVNVSQSNITLTGINTASYAPTGFAYDPATFTATWSFAAFAVDRETLTLDANSSAAITDLAGIRLDGEFTNGTSPLPSGDGSAGGNFVFNFNTLPADTDQSGFVDGVDLTAIRRRQLISAGGTGYSVMYDVDGSGMIDGVDLTAVRRRQLIGLP